MSECDALEVAKKLMEVCRIEANRLSYHWDDNPARQASQNLRKAANEAKAQLADIPDEYLSDCENCGKREFIPSKYNGKVLCKSCSAEQYRKDMETD